MNTNLTVDMPNCNHRRWVPELVELVRSGAVRPSRILPRVEGLTDAVEAHVAFDRREEGWTKVALDLAS
jgi:threonine dehydrogenase-like Zn-dependent dehydrogenase